MEGCDHDMGSSSALPLVGRTLEYGSQDYLRGCTLRNEALRKPLGIQQTPEELANDKNGIHLGGFLQNDLVACASIWKTDNFPIPFQIRQVAVTSRMRGKGFGRWIMNYAESIAVSHGAKSVFVHARKHVLPFYLNLDYLIVGEEFIEVGIPHLKMTKSMDGKMGFREPAI